MSDLPVAFKFWPDYAQDAYREREALMRDGNNVPPDAPTPLAIRMAAIRCAEEEIRLYREWVKTATKSQPHQTPLPSDTAIGTVVNEARDPKTDEDYR